MIGGARALSWPNEGDRGDRRLNVGARPGEGGGVLPGEGGNGAYRQGRAPARWLHLRRKWLHLRPKWRHLSPRLGAAEHHCASFDPDHVSVPPRPLTDPPSTSRVAPSSPVMAKRVGPRNEPADSAAGLRGRLNECVCREIMITVPFERDQASDDDHRVRAGVGRRFAANSRPALRFRSRLSVRWKCTTPRSRRSSP